MRKCNERTSQTISCLRTYSDQFKRNSRRKTKKSNDKTAHEIWKETTFSLAAKRASHLAAKANLLVWLLRQTLIVIAGFKGKLRAFFFLCLFF